MERYCLSCNYLLPQFTRFIWNYKCCFFMKNSAFNLWSTFWEPTLEHSEQRECIYQWSRHSFHLLVAFSVLRHLKRKWNQNQELWCGWDIDRPWISLPFVFLQSVTKIIWILVDSVVDCIYKLCWILLFWVTSAFISCFGFVALDFIESQQILMPKASLIF